MVVSTSATADRRLGGRQAGRVRQGNQLQQRLRLLGVRVGKLVRADAPETRSSPAADAALPSAHHVAEPPPVERTLDLF